MFIAQFRNVFTGETVNFRYRNTKDNTLTRRLIKIEQSIRYLTPIAIFRVKIKPDK